MISITKNGITRTYPDNVLPQVCLQLCGGGYTTKQTANAMILQSKLQSSGSAKLGKVSIKYETAAEPDLGQMFDMAYEDQCRDACGL